MRRLVPLAMILLAGCRTAPVPHPADGPPTELAEPATTLSAGASGKGSTGAPQPTVTAGPGTTPGATSTTAPPQPFRTIATISDDSGDAGLRAPSYADLRSVKLESNGTSARMTVSLGARVPNPMPSGEQMAVGVDLYRTAGQRESDYQLYASGTEQGWLAYLTTPNGFVEYPGRFEVGGTILRFTVPWASLGDLRGREFSAFLDWDREGAVLNTVGQDATGRARFGR